MLILSRSFFLTWIFFSPSHIIVPESVGLSVLFCQADWKEQTSKCKYLRICWVTTVEYTLSKTEEFLPVVGRSKACCQHLVHVPPILVDFSLASRASTATDSTYQPSNNDRLPDVSSCIIGHIAAETTFFAHSNCSKLSSIHSFTIRPHTHYDTPPQKNIHRARHFGLRNLASHLSTVPSTPTSNATRL